MKALQFWWKLPLEGRRAVGLDASLPSNNALALGSCWPTVPSPPPPTALLWSAAPGRVPCEAEEDPTEELCCDIGRSFPPPVPSSSEVGSIVTADRRAARGLVGRVEVCRRVTAGGKTDPSSALLALIRQWPPSRSSCGMRRGAVVRRLGPRRPNRNKTAEFAAAAPTVSAPSTKGVVNILLGAGAAAAEALRRPRRGRALVEAGPLLVALGATDAIHVVAAAVGSGSVGGGRWRNVVGARGQPPPHRLRHSGVVAAVQHEGRGGVPSRGAGVRIVHCAANGSPNDRVLVHKRPLLSRACWGVGGIGVVGGSTQML